MYGKYATQRLKRGLRASGGGFRVRTCVRDFGGSLHGRFARAIERRQVRNAEMVAREMGRLSLADALSLVALYAAVNDAKFEQAACRLLGRLSLEGRDMTLGTLQFAAAALAELRGRRHEAALKALLWLI